MAMDQSDCSILSRYIIIDIINSGAQALSQASFDQGSGMIWLSNVQCTGNERELVTCLRTSSENSSCTHSQDAGVRCLSGVFCSYFDKTYLGLTFKAALREMLGCLKGTLNWKVVWRSVRTTDGAQCVIMDGTLLIPEWCVNN